MDVTENNAIHASGPTGLHNRSQLNSFFSLVNERDMHCPER